MIKPLTAIEVNCETGEILERELSQEELTQRRIDEAAFAAEQAAKEAEEEAVAAAKASAESKLAALGLSAEEIAALSK